MTDTWRYFLTHWRRLGAPARSAALVAMGVPLVALATALAIATALSAEAQDPPVQHPNIFHRPETFRGPNAPGAPGLSGPSNLQFHGGPVMTSFTAYLIFWLPPGVHFSSNISDANYEQLITRYFQDVGGTPFYNIVTQYPGSNGTPANAVTFGGSVEDTRRYPRPGTAADPILDLHLHSEISRVITEQSWPTGLDVMYFVFTGSGIQSCFDSSHTSCSQSQYCAYHSAFTLDGQPVIYANMPDGVGLGDCGYSNVTGDPSADVEISIVSHEHIEALTDPTLMAWFDSDLSGEIADKCAYNYGPASADPSTPNVFLNGNPYRLQREWSNGSSACALSLCGTSVCAPAMTQTTTATTCVAGTGGDAITYTVQYDNPSDVDAATHVSIKDTLPPGAHWTSGTPPSSTVGSVLTFNRPDVSVHGGGTIQFTATVTSPSPAFTNLTDNTTLKFSDSLSEVQPSVGASAATAVPCGPWCGNGAVDPGEQCDDRNLVNGDGCDSNCTVTGCGNGVMTGGEQCDDGNITNGDGCSATCAVESCEIGPPGACNDCAAVGVPDGASCSDGVFCNGADSCLGGTCSVHAGNPCLGGPECNNQCNETADDCLVAAGTSCSSDANPCTLDECNVAGACVHPAGNGGVVCRPSAGVCDVAETCTGTSPTCPSDDFQPSSVTCRVALGVCDVAEHCTGSSASCPSDAMQPDTATCRPATDVCDVAEICSGGTTTCPIDALQPNTVVCRPATIGCDFAESCSGSSAACPPDNPSGTTVAKPRVILRQLNTPSGDDKLTFTGEFTLPEPYTPPLDPRSTGVRVLIQTALGATVVDATIPNGAYNRTTRVGWMMNRRVPPTRWTYLNRGGVQGITRTVVTNKSSAETPGRITFLVRGKNGSFGSQALTPSDIPLLATLALDASAGECAEATFPGPTPTPSCAFSTGLNPGNTLKCK